MAYYYDLYGFTKNDLEQLRAELETVLEFQFTAHDSMYRGGLYYRCDRSRSESFQLQNNYNPAEEEYTEEQFSEYPLLLYVNEAEAPLEIQEKLLSNLTSVKLLQRKIL